ncbi:MAG: DUF2062 domain-containing protein [Candidatus Solibacter sp.]|nr:DUF2062 domain-containing protein [Candidatus Solibacter sp.]
MIRRKLVQPFLDLLRPGITPEKIALTIALGLALGITPVIGSTTLLCTFAAIVLRLNLPAIQLVNGVVYPLQLILIVPFLRAGGWLFDDSGASALTPARLFSLIRGDAWHAIVTLWTATMHALVAWLTVSAAAAALLYVILVPVLKRVWRRQAAAR